MLPPQANQLLERSSLRLFDVLDFRGCEGRTYSVLCISTPQGMEIDDASFRYLSNRRFNGASYRRVRAAYVSLGLLYEFYKVVWKGRVLSEGELPSLVGEFLSARRHGISYSSDGQKLVWQPVKVETMLRDRHFIAEYAEFCVGEFAASYFRRFGAEDYNNPSYRKALKRIACISAASRSTNLLHHLTLDWKPRREAPFGYEERSARRKRISEKRFLRFDAIRKLIDGTTSLIQKMLYIEAYFGGPRLCEMLNHWRCDVLSGDMRPVLFSDDVPLPTPLVVNAHPTQARYTGSLEDFSLDRLQVLRRDYGLRPRSEQAGQALSAGWKGITFDDDYKRISQIFWLHTDYAILFGECFAKVCREIYPAIPPSVLSSHPYLYVNDDLRRKEFGRPLKYSNARKAHARAVESLGVDGALIGKGIHAARHSYRARMKDFGFSREDQQRCMHHASADSQEEYGKGVSDLNARLVSILQKDTGR